MSYVIEKGVPIPEKLAVRKGRFPLREMKAGDSIGVGPTEKTALISAAGNFRLRNPGWSYTRRNLKDGGVRIWCTAVADGKNAAPAKAPTPRPPRASCPGTPPPPEAENQVAENPVAAKLRQLCGKTKPSVHTHRPR